MNKELELFLKFQLEAQHSLEERDTPHTHIWRIEVGLQGPVIEGRIVSMPQLRQALDPVLLPLQKTYLNENPLLDPDTRRFPTCENLALYLESALSHRLRGAGITARLSQIRVAVEEVDGQETGSVLLRIAEGG